MNFAATGGFTHHFKNHACCEVRDPSCLGQGPLHHFYVENVFVNIPKLLVADAIQDCHHNAPRHKWPREFVDRPRACNQLLAIEQFLPVCRCSGSCKCLGALLWSVLHRAGMSRVSYGTASPVRPRGAPGEH